MPKDAEFLLRRSRQALKAAGAAFDRVAKDGKPVQSAIPASSRISIEMAGRGNKSVKFNRLFVVGETKAPSPFERRVMVADQRWWWPWNHVSASYNLRRVSGNRRVISEPGAPLAEIQIADDVTFRSSSINPATKAPWTALEVLKDVMTRVCGDEGKDWRFAAGATALGEGLVQDFVIDDPGQVAVNKALGLCTGLDVYQDEDGFIVIDRTLPGDYDSVLGNLGPPLLGGGVIQRIDLSLKRSSRVHSISTREIGMRFDALNPGDSRTDEEPYLENVLQTTDPLTTLSDTGETVPLGTYARAERLYDSWQSQILATSPKAAVLLNAHPLNDANIRKNFVAKLRQVYAALGTTAIEPNFKGEAYCGEIKANYRQLWRMNPNWSDLALRVIAKNPGYIDPETGGEGKSPVYADYAAMPTMLGFSVAAKQDKIAINYLNGVDRYVSGGRLAGATRAPANVVVVSEQLGIIHTGFDLDPEKTQAKILPSALKDDTIPTRKWQELVTTFNETSLAQQHRLSVILTLVPGLPNSDGRFHRISISPTDVEQRFGVKIGDCAGPVREARVGEGLATAQFPYDEAKHEDYIRAFNPGGRLGPAPRFDLLGDPINQDALRELALSQALAEYLPRLDHYAGTQLVPLRRGLVPRGEAQTISYTMTTTGALLTTITAGYTDGGAAINPLNLLPQSARRVLLRAVNPVGA